MSLHELDRPIAFHRCFVELAGSVDGAVFLSQFVYWHNRVDREFYKTQQEIEEETGIKKDRQTTIRKALKKKRIISEELRGIPAKMYYRVNEENVRKLLNLQVSEIPQTRRGPEPQQEEAGNLNKKRLGASTITETTTENTSETTTKTDMSGKPDVPPKSKPAKSKKSKPLPPIEDAVEVLEHLNGAASKCFRSRNNAGELTGHIEAIRKRLKSHTKPELIAMIDHRVWLWLNNDKMCQYLRPATLFCKSKCEEYIDAASNPDAYQTASGNHQHARPSRPQTLVEQVQQSFDQQYGPITQQPYIEGEFSSAPDSAGHAAFVGQDDSDIYAQVDPYCDQ